MKNVKKFAAVSAIAISSILGVSAPTASAAPVESPAVTAPGMATLPAAPTPGEMNTMGVHYRGPYSNQFLCASATWFWPITSITRDCRQHDDGQWWFITNK